MARGLPARPAGRGQRRACSGPAAGRGVHLAARRPVSCAGGRRMDRIGMAVCGTGWWVGCSTGKP